MLAETKLSTITEQIGGDEAKRLNIIKQIDADEGLKSKRKMLTVTSLIVLALSFSGATIEGVNTFILEISFSNDKGITILLVLAVIFLLLRYHNYACKYHQQLYEIWTGRLLRDSFFRQYEPNSDEATGFIWDHAPRNVDFKHGDWNVSFKYKCGLFSRKITYLWEDKHSVDKVDVTVGWKNYFKLIPLEMSYQREAIFKHRESLDILTPYLLGVTAILSYFCNGWLVAILQMLVVS